MSNGLEGKSKMNFWRGVKDETHFAINIMVSQLVVSNGRQHRVQNAENTSTKPQPWTLLHMEMQPQGTVVLALVVI